MELDVSAELINYNSTTDFSIILDLDETLIHTFVNNIDVEALDDMDYIKLGKDTLFFIKRPFLDQFLLFCHDYFHKVIIWSAGEDKYVKKIVDIIFKDLKLDLVWARSKCSKKNHGKPIQKIIDNTEMVSLGLTFFIDDKDFNLLDDLKNGIIIPEFSPKTKQECIETQDNALDLLMKWFSLPDITYADDVRKLNLGEIFD